MEDFMFMNLVLVYITWYIWIVNVREENIAFGKTNIKNQQHFKVWWVGKTGLFEPWVGEYKYI